MKFKKEAESSIEGSTSFEEIDIWSVVGIAILGLLYAIFLRRKILKEDKGTLQMQDVWNAIREGAEAYLRSQLRSILPLILILTVALFLSVYIAPPTQESLERFSDRTESEVRLIIGLGRAVAFVFGVIFSLAVGQIGMRMAVQVNVHGAFSAMSDIRRIHRRLMKRREEDGKARENQKQVVEEALKDIIVSFCDQLLHGIQSLRISEMPIRVIVA